MHIAKEYLVFGISKIDLELFLYQLGTDQLENLFSTVRTLSRNFVSFSELVERLVLAQQIESVYERNEKWRQPNRVSSSFNETLDHSSAYCWKGDLTIFYTGFNLVKIWNHGYKDSKVMLSEYGYREVDFELESSVTMLRPFGFDVVLNDEEVLDDELVIEEELNEEESSEQVPEEELHELQDFLELMKFHQTMLPELQQYS